MGVSTTDSPVTQTAEIEVNSATSGDGPPGPVVDTGSNSTSAPASDATRNATGTARAGWDSVRMSSQRHRRDPNLEERRSDRATLAQPPSA